MGKPTTTRPRRQTVRMAQKRLMKERTLMESQEDSRFELGPSPDILEWNVILKSEVEPYASFNIPMKVVFTSTYPFKGPSIFFNCKMYHPNVDDSGKLCMAVLDKAWKPTMKVAELLKTIIVMLEDPNTDDPLNSEACELFRSKKSEYIKKVTKTLKGSCTMRYAPFCRRHVGRDVFPACMG